MEYFPFADSPEIIRAHQKDAQVELQIRQNARDLIQWARGVRFLHSWSSEIDTACKAMYLGLTTLVGARTLGEEYTDLIYITEGRELPSRLRIMLFVVGSSLGPLVLNRWVATIRSKVKALTEGGKWEFIADWTTPKTLVSINLAVFYFMGAYYQLAKRILGLRYALGHARNPMEARTGSYELLGLLMVVRGIGKVVNIVSETAGDEPAHSQSYPGQEESLSESGASLSDPEIMPFVPDESRACNLCLESIQSPTLTLCGHLYCWSCITEWCRERPECPLCRQTCAEQQLLLLTTKYSAPNQPALKS